MLKRGTLLVIRRSPESAAVQRRRTLSRAVARARQNPDSARASLARDAAPICTGSVDYHTTQPALSPIDWRERRYASADIAGSLTPPDIDALAWRGHSRGSQWHNTRTRIVHGMDVCKRTLRIGSTIHQTMVWSKVLKMALAESSLCSASM